jgi:CHAT domain-containing protein
VRGLVRAFFYAGTSGVVASLWPVLDYPAFKMIEWFHASLRRTGDPAEAMRLAALAARERWIDPSIWGAFVLYGI